MLRSDEESRWSAGKASLARLLRRRQRFSRDPQPYCRLLGPRPALEFIMRFSALDSWHWFRPPKRIFSAGHRKLLKRLGFSPPKGKPFSIVNENLFVFTCHLQFFITLLNLFFIGSCFSFLPVGNDRTEPNGAGNGPRKCLEDVFAKIIISYEVGKVEFKSFEKGIFFYQIRDSIISARIVRVQIQFFVFDPSAAIQAQFQAWNSDDPVRRRIYKIIFHISYFNWNSENFNWSIVISRIFQWNS